MSQATQTKPYKKKTNTYNGPTNAELVTKRTLNKCKSTAKAFINHIKKANKGLYGHIRVAKFDDQRMGVFIETKVKHANRYKNQCVKVGITFYPSSTYNGNQTRPSVNVIVTNTSKKTQVRQKFKAPMPTMVDGKQEIQFPCDAVFTYVKEAIADITKA